MTDLFDRRRSLSTLSFSLVIAELEAFGMRVCTFDPGGPGDPCHPPEVPAWRPISAADAIQVAYEEKQIDQWGRVR